MTGLSSPRSVDRRVVGAARGRCRVVASVVRPPTRPAALPAFVDGLEVRADLVGDLPPTVLGARHGIETIYSLRSAAEGGAFTGGAHERARRLLDAATRYDVVELEAERDLTPELLDALAVHRRRISWRGPATRMSTLAARSAWLTATPARQYLVETRPENAEQALLPLRLLAFLRRADITAFAGGESGGWTRLLAPRLGAPVISGLVGESGVDGEPSVRQLVGDYHFPALPEVRTLFGIVGGTVCASLSPRLHNAAYRALGLPALYLPFAVADLRSFWRHTAVEEFGFTFGGATVVSPHKEVATRIARTVSSEARASGAANLLVRRRNGWRAFSTDPVGVVEALRCGGVDLAGRRTVVVGCGGAGRGAAVGLLRAGARPTLVNRGSERGRYSARLLGLDHVPLARFDPADYDLVVHATTVRDHVPFPVDRMASGSVVLDLTYGPRRTELVAAAEKARLAVLDGWDVLVVEVARQFRLMTGRSMPPITAELLRSSARVSE
jgi:3-dehydroquinate dehydratase/shikimate dehydrogenase